MTRSTQILILLVTPLSAATGQPVSSDHAAFAASNGNVIELNTRIGSLVLPGSRSTRLQDCSDKFQVCLTEHHGFAFAYFRKCNDARSGDYKRLRFPPKVVSALHNSDVWMVFDAAPKYLFHYAYSKGIVGIYLGPTASFDFFNVFHDRNFQLDSLDVMEYHITASGTGAACSQ